MPTPKLQRQVTTLWDYPSQNYGREDQGDRSYIGATPSYIIWNCLMRYTNEKDLVVDPMCGSGTTLDVCRDTNRRPLGYDVNPTRKDIFRCDARKLPLENGKVDFVFVDPPYGDNVNYSDEKGCIGKLPAYGEEYFKAMEEVIAEINRILRPDRYMALYVCDYYDKKNGFVPIGFRLYQMLSKHFSTVDIISVTRHNKTINMGNYRKAADEGNFYLRGFNYLFIMKKEGRGAPRKVGTMPELPAEKKSRPESGRGGVKPSAKGKAPVRGRSGGASSGRRGTGRRTDNHGKDKK
ncbi:MAG TPA: DNA methyltransferase [Spirochaetota bacterium]|nr:DNA methyltransferase [Spirochaetota bacterium]HPJ35284.1 DNA methyltransferase [Spirochaetota bacterium]